MADVYLKDVVPSVAVATDKVMVSRADGTTPEAVLLSAIATLLQAHAPGSDNQDLTTLLINNMIDAAGDITHAPTRKSMFDELALKLADATGSIATDGKQYVRKNGGWVEAILAITASHTNLSPVEGSLTFRPSLSITAFDVPATHTITYAIPISVFQVADAAVITGYMITESATPPTLGDDGWLASAPTTYTVASIGAKTLYAWIKDGVNVANATAFGGPISDTCTVSDIATLDQVNWPSTSLSYSGIKATGATYQGKAQAFVAGVSGNLLKVDLAEFYYSGAAANITVNILSDNAGTPGATVLATAIIPSFTTPNYSSGVDDTAIAAAMAAPREIIFSTPATLVSGTKYWIETAINDGSTAYYVEVIQTGTAAGTHYTRSSNGGAWVTMNTIKSHYRTYMG